MGCVAYVIVPEIGCGARPSISITSINTNNITNALFYHLDWSIHEEGKSLSFSNTLRRLISSDFHQPNGFGVGAVEYL